MLVVPFAVVVNSYVEREEREKDRCAFVHREMCKYAYIISVRVY